MQRSADVEAIEVHYLRPRGRKIFDELLLRIGAAVDVDQATQI